MDRRSLARELERIDYEMSVLRPMLSIADELRTRSGFVRSTLDALSDQMGKPADVRELARRMCTRRIVPLLEELDRECCDHRSDLQPLVSFDADVVHAEIRALIDEDGVDVLKGVPCGVADLFTRAEAFVSSARSRFKSLTY